MKKLEQVITFTGYKEYEGCLNVPLDRVMRATITEKTLQKAIFRGIVKMR